jgi:hypothetical protein
MKKNTTSTKLKIQNQELIKEVETKSYEIVRLYRIKYFENDYNFIDIRFYQRGYDDKGEEVFYPTKKGVQIKEDLFKKLCDDFFLENLKKQL